MVFTDQFLSYQAKQQQQQQQQSEASKPVEPIMCPVPGGMMPEPPQQFMVRRSLPSLIYIDLNNTLLLTLITTRYSIVLMSVRNAGTDKEQRKLGEKKKTKP